jgi:hypothetical protein
MMWWQILADSVVAFHAAYVAFVVFGLIAILTGYAMSWRWVRNLYFRATHLAAILLVCIEAVVGVACPLTTLENALRLRAGGVGYPGDFLGYWLDWMIFYNAPPWVFTAIYLGFGALVLTTFWLVPINAATAHRRRA